MTKRHAPRRDFLRAGAAALAGLGGAGEAFAQTPAQAPAQPPAQTPPRPSITGGTESAFPSAEAPGSSDGGYNILFILTDQEHYMGPGWPVPLPGHERLRRTGTYFENHQIAADAGRGTAAAQAQLCAGAPARPRP